MLELEEEAKQLQAFITAGESGLEQPLANALGAREVLKQTLKRWRDPSRGVVKPEPLVLAAFEKSQAEFAGSTAAMDACFAVGWGGVAAKPPWSIPVGQVLGADHGVTVDKFGRAVLLDGVSRKAHQDLSVNPRLAPFGALYFLDKKSVPFESPVQQATRLVLAAHPDGKETLRKVCRVQFPHRVASLRRRVAPGLVFAGGGGEVEEQADCPRVDPARVRVRGGLHGQLQRGADGRHRPPLQQEL